MARPKRNKASADNLIKFIQALNVPSGVGAGEPFSLLPFQVKFLRDIYEPQVDGKRVVRRAVQSVARKNGKSATIACLALAHLVGPQSELNGEIYSAATEREQAALIFKMAAQIVRGTPFLQPHVKIIDSTKTMVCHRTGSFYRALSAEAGSKHGLNPTMVIYDELAQAKNRALFDVLDTSMGAREEPLFITISTQSHDPQHILSQLIDDGLTHKDPTTVVHLYETPEGADIWKEKNWRPSNPALGKFRTIADMRALAARAKRMPSFEPAFRNLFLNQRVDATSPLFSRSEWEACAGDGPALGEKVYLALDLSSTTDLTAMVAISAEGPSKTRSWFWKPKELLRLHEDRDRAPYTEWVRMGHIEAPPGRAIDYGFVAQRIAEVATDYDVQGLAFDRWRIELLLKELSAYGVESFIDGKDTAIHGGLRLCPWGQGFRDMAPAIDALEVAVIERTLSHDQNPVLTWNIANTIVISDPAGNRKLDKSKSRFRIDGAVALTMAAGLKARETVEDTASVYDDRGIDLW